MIFQATFDNGAEKLRNIVDLLKDHVSECVFNLDQTGIFIQSLDSSLIALVDIFIDQDYPLYYRCDDPCSIGVNISALHTILKFAGKKGTCVLRQDTPDVLSISCSGESTKETTATYELKLLDIAKEKVFVPKMTHHSVQKISPVELQRILKQLSELSEDVVVTKTDTKLSFAALGDAANAILTVHTETRTPEEITSKFSLKYLLWAAKVASFSKDDIEFAFDPHQPLMITYRTESIDVKFFIPMRED